MCKFLEDLIKTKEVKLMKRKKQSFSATKGTLVSDRLTDLASFQTHPSVYSLPTYVLVSERSYQN